MKIRGTKLSNRVGMTFAYMGCMPLLFLTGYLTYYYTAVLGLDAIKLGTIFLISRVFDGISDVMFGTVIDHTKTRLGVCRPWILSMTVGSIFAIFILFKVPIGNSLKYLYVFFAYNLATTVITTIYQLAVVSLPSYITRDSNERSQLYIWANTGQMITQTFISGILLKVVERLGGDQNAWVVTALGMGIIGAVITGLAVYLCKETVDPSKLTGQSNNLSFRAFVSSLKSCVNNKYWWILLGIVILVAGVNITAVTMTPYYARYVLGSVTTADTINMFYFWPMMIMVPVVGLIVGKLTKRNISLLGGIVVLGGSLISILFKTNLVGLCVSAMLKSMGIGCITAVCPAMLADTIEYGQWKNGVRNQAVLIGAQSAGTKIGNGLTGAILSWSIAFVGFNAQQEIQSTSVINGFTAIYCLVPMILVILAVVLLFVYDLDKKLPGIMADLGLRESNCDKQNSEMKDIGL